MMLYPTGEHPRVGVIIDAPATAGIWLPLHDTLQASNSYN